MTLILTAANVAERLENEFPGSIIESDESGIQVKREKLLDVLTFLKTNAEFELDYLNHLSAVDYRTHFEIIYLLTSIKRNHCLQIKTKIDDRNHPAVPSVTGLWRGADLQEREIFDLFGIVFEGHPELKRIFLWEGFPGFPLRKE